MRSVWSICRFVCEQDYCKSNQPISLKRGVMIELTKQKKLLTSGDDPVLDTDFESFMHFTLTTEEWVFLRKLLVFLVHSPADFHYTRQND